MSKTLKHLDWNRIGWTVGIPAIIAGGIWIPWLIGRAIRGSYIDSLYYSASTNSAAMVSHELSSWLIGAGIIISPLVLILLVITVTGLYRLIKKVCVRFINFYYHNDEEKEKDEPKGKWKTYSSGG